MDFRVVISDPRSGKAYQVEVKDPGASKLLGRKIGDSIEGDSLGMPGYKLKITGGSDREGFPMRQDLPGTRRRRVLIAGGVGYHPLAEGRKRRKSIHGREISPDIGQINVKIVEAGAKAVEEILGKAQSAEEKK
jgi:small subunit ribosomal protein S6e